MLLQTLVNKYPNHKDEVIKMVGDLLNLSKEKIALNYKEIELSSFQIKRIDNNIKKLKQGVPLPYLTNKQYFFDHEFIINKNTLIPRFETEILVSEAIKIAKKTNCKNIIDIGTGSGNIIISMNIAIGEKPNYFGVDISKRALREAKKNAIKNRANKITFLHSNLFSNKKLPKKFDLILANLPYLESEYLTSLPKEIAKTLRFEPRIALDGGENGLEIIESLLSQLNQKMHQHSSAIIEIGDSQISEVIKLCNKNKLQTKTINDLNTFARFVIIKKRTRQA